MSDETEKIAEEKVTWKGWISLFILIILSTSFKNTLSFLISSNLLFKSTSFTFISKNSFHKYIFSPIINST